MRGVIEPSPEDLMVWESLLIDSVVEHVDRVEQNEDEKPSRMRISMLSGYLAPSNCCMRDLSDTKATDRTWTEAD